MSKINNIYSMNNTNQIFDTELVAYPLGENKDSINIETVVYINNTTGVVEKLEYKVKLNRFTQNKELFISKIYKESYDFILQYIEDNYKPLEAEPEAPSYE